MTTRAPAATRPRPASHRRRIRPTRGALLLAATLLVTACGVEAGELSGSPSPTTEASGPRPTAEGPTDTEPKEVTTTTSPRTTTTSEPEVDVESFGDGTHLVGEDIPPGRYMAEDVSDFCAWETLADLTDSDDSTINIEITDARAVVDVDESVTAFEVDGCGRWVPHEAPARPATRFEDGDWVVGEDIEPGRYRSRAGTEDCYIERASGFTHDFDELITNELGPGPITIDIVESDERVTSSDCGAWQKL